MGLLQDPQFWLGLKSAFQSFQRKYLKAGSSKGAVNIKGFLVSNIIILALFLLPIKAHASLFSFISNLFATTPALAQEVEPNSQNIPLLQATNSPDQGATSTSDDIVIVGGTSLSPETQLPTDVKNLENDQISLYVVHQGDTLPAIAKMFGVTVNTIKWANNISGNTLSVGQTLVILPISGVQHIVKSGDTLESIAKLHKGDLNEILQYNGLSKDSKLSIGDVIFIPDGEASPSSSYSGGSSGGKNSGSYGGAGSPPVGSYCQNFPSHVGYYMRPVASCIKTQGVHGHNGVDLASSYGTSILAAADGVVIISKDSGWNGGYGSYIVLKHDNGTETLYAHLSATLVSVGDSVSQGDVIGKMGHSGDVNGPTGTHLHFEIRGAKNPF